MSIINSIKETCRSLGKNNKPTYVVMAIAAVKWICRPAFTMMDKTEDPKTKKYTALREGLTEAIAIPAYWGCGELAAKLANHVFKDEALAKRAEKNLMFLGVCTAALVVIPGLCSAVIKPIMDKLGLKAPVKGEKPQQQVQQPEQAQAVLNTPQQFKKPIQQKDVYKPTMNGYMARPNMSGLRVGGL